MEYTKLENINEYKSQSINPMNQPDEIFEMYSVPRFKTGHPEYLRGSEIASSKLLVKKNDVLLCKINPRINRVWVVKDESDKKNIASSEWIVIRSKQYNPEFLAWYLRTPQFQQLMMSEVTGIGGSLTRAQPNRVSGYPVPVLDRRIQDNIVKVLNLCRDTITNRRLQLEKLDTLIKARFVEMFGDPVSNYYGWKRTMLNAVTTKIGSGATPRGGRESYQSEGISLIRSMNVYDGQFKYKDLAHITEQQAAQLDNVIVEENDVFINITGASVARSCIVPDEILPARVNQHVAIIRCIEELMNPVFANNIFINDSFKRQLLSIGESGGATRQAITKQQLENLIVILPPLERQQRFAAFVHQTYKLKVAIQKSLEETQLLFNSLMQEYFG